MNWLHKKECFLQFKGGGLHLCSALVRYIWCEVKGMHGLGEASPEKGHKED